MEDMDGSNIAAVAPAPGVLSNFRDPRTLSRNLMTSNTVLLSLKLLVVDIQCSSRALSPLAIG